MSGRKTYPIRYKIRFSENLKKKMREYHMSQSELARRMGVTRCSVSYWCNGRTIPCGEREKNSLSYGRMPKKRSKEYERIYF